MKIFVNTAYVFGAGAVLTLLAAGAGRLIGDPHIFIGTKISNWISLSSCLTLLGILAALLALLADKEH